VFDGDLLVGTVVYSGEPGQQILAWADDETTEEVDGFLEGHIITFKVYDLSESMVMQPVNAEYIDYSDWNTDGVFSSEYISGVNLVIYTNELSDGWSWTGFPILPENPITAEEFFGSVLDDVIIVKSQESGSMVNIEDIWVGGDFIINNMDGYIIKMVAGVSFSHPNQVRVNPSDVIRMTERYTCHHLDDVSIHIVNYKISTNPYVFNVHHGSAFLTFDNYHIIQDRPKELLCSYWILRQNGKSCPAPSVG
jgi:hypothetical protein